MSKLSDFWNQRLYDAHSSIASAKLSFGRLVVRVTSCFSLIYGQEYGKLISFGEEATTFEDSIGLGRVPVPSMVLTIFAEFFCSLALVFGVATRLAAILLMIQMIIIAFVVHISDPFGGKEELALLYLSSFVLIFLTGPGRYSVDAIISAKTKREVIAMPDNNNAGGRPFCIMPTMSMAMA